LTVSTYGASISRSGFGVHQVTLDGSLGCHERWHGSSARRGPSARAAERPGHRCGPSVHHLGQSAPAAPCAPL